MTKPTGNPMGRPRLPINFTPEEVAKKYNEGMKTNALNAYFNSNSTRIYEALRIAQSRGVRVLWRGRGPAKVSVETKQRVLDMYNDGDLLEDIAHKNRIDPRTIYEILYELEDEGLWVRWRRKKTDW